MIRIRRETLEVKVVGTEAEGLAVRARLAQLCAQELPAAIERALSPLDPDGAVLRIDRLDIDLPTLGLALDDVVPQIAAEVRERVHRLRRAGVDTLVPEHEDSAVATARRLSVGEAADEALLVFLTTGRLPWSFRLPAGADLATALQTAWDEDGGPVATGTRQDRLREVLRSSSARTRLHGQLPHQLRFRLLTAIAPATAAAARTVLTGGNGDLPARSHAERRVLDAAFAAAAEGSPVTAAELAEAVLEGAAAPTAENRPAAKTGDRPDRTASPEQRGLVGAGAPAPSGPAASTDLTPSTEPAAPSDGRPPAGAGPPLTRSAASDHPSRDQPREETVGLPDRTLRVDAAGIVLLHVFLPRYLEGLGAASGDMITAPQRAVALLHLLATGERTVPEHRATLAKLLCGMPLTTPLDADQGLGTAEDEEADALLRAAIEHWGALGGSEPAALRGEFLNREGLLELATDGDPTGEDRLHVGTRGSDVLLEALPWPVSLIQLPWMPRMLSVQWGPPHG
ncbi:contractile injection system tape measure protein [Brachybacterium vulturis]|uniref:contractile injection system tape measure protein n=1 Tax=Brachybacterium vulturis TaxID=2017484 RepID=UPI003736F1AC